MQLLWRNTAALLVVMMAVVAGTANVTYDGRSLIIDGQRKMLFSGSIHYPRSTPDMWPSLISKAKQGGIDVIETYVFWNLHEPQPGQYDFSGGRDIVAFMKEIQAQGLYACLRIGPYIEAEWTYGGFPFWLHDVPGIVYRSDNEPFKFYMQNFTTKIVNLMKSEGLYASQGGPIILSQIENEYQNKERSFREKGPPYVRWAAKMAVELETGVPWIMCKQDDAPDPVINTCNGRACGETFKGPNSPNKPSIWTENWTSFYQVYGENAVIRSAEEMAFQVALFIARKNGTYVNYYMYHGGTNFGRSAAEFMITGYYDQAPLDEYGLIRQPKWGHFKELHAAVKLCSENILSAFPTMHSLGPLQEAYVFGGDSETKCSAFLVNTDRYNKGVTVQFRNLTYQLPPKSISILPDCKTIAFNTAKVSTQFNTRSPSPVFKLDRAEKWEQFEEVIPQFDATTVRSQTLLEQTNTTKDVSDYLWYTTSLEQESEEQQAKLSVKSLGHVLHAFVNGRLVGYGHGQFRNPSFTVESTVPLNKGTNQISFLSATVGLPNSGAFLERRSLGVRSVMIQEDSRNLKNFTDFSWGYQVGLLGEKLQIYTSEGAKSANWSNLGSSKQLTWYKYIFDAPKGHDPVTLNLGSMGKGEAWVNGQSIGRYWLSFHTSQGVPSQTWYNVPRSFLKPKDNVLVLFEEEIGNPLNITIDTISITKVCAHVTDSNPPPLNSWRKYGTSMDHKIGERHHGRRPKVHLSCPPRRKISKILFASFGNPTGNCDDYAMGQCHSSNSKAIVEKVCLGKRKCTIVPSSKKFGRDPCPGIPKSLLVDVQCK